MEWKRNEYGMKENERWMKEKQIWNERETNIEWKRILYGMKQKGNVERTWKQVKDKPTMNSKGNIQTVKNNKIKHMNWEHVLRWNKQKIKAMGMIILL